ncbi:MAG: hypothetical protein ACPGSB_04850 [Opitutales bacterium]
MKKISLLLFALSALVLIGCGKEYTQVQKKDLGQAFIVNSSPTFKGYFYEGSDRDFHYFTSRWKYGSDLKMKIAKDDLKVAKEFDFGSGELGLHLFKREDSGPLFCEVGNTTIYETVAE